nr:G protein-coupled receptor [Proales similis]
MMKQEEMANISLSSQQIEALSIKMSSLSFYCGVILAPIGITLNVLSALIFFTRPRLNKNSSMGLIHGLISVCDCATIIFYLVLFVNILPSLDINLQLDSLFACRFGTFISRVVVNMASWLRVYTSFECYMFVRHRNMSLFLTSKLKLGIMIVAFLAFICLLHTLTLTFWIKFEHQSHNFTAPKLECGSTEAVNLIAQTIYSLMRTIIPFVFMAYFSIKTISRMKNSRSNTNSNDPRRSRRDRAFILSVLTLNILFIIFFFPSMFFYVYTNIRNEFYWETISPESLKLDELLLLVSRLLSRVYQTFTPLINFLLNRQFRAEVYDVFTKKGKK